MPEKIKRKKVVLTKLDLEDAKAANTGAAERWQHAAEPTYDVVAAKAHALPRGSKPHSTGEHGVEWGTVIHTLLEAAMVKPGTELKSLAVSSLNEQGLELSLVDSVLETVDTVTHSELWTRAKVSKNCLVEVPFTTLLPDTTPETVMRGVIDLAFLEPGGWVIVDYKTEKVEEDAIKDLVEYYQQQVRTYADQWSRIVGQDVQEAGLFFTHQNHYVTMPL